MTREQAHLVYKKTESGEIIHTETTQQELEFERQLDMIDDTSGDTNPYKELIVNNAEKLETVSTQMEQWSILSNTLNYIGHDKLPKNFHSLDISVVYFYKNNSGMVEENVIEIDFGTTPDILREEYLDMYERIHSVIVNTTRFDKIQILATHTLGDQIDLRMKNLKQKNLFPYQNMGMQEENC